MTKEQRINEIISAMPSFDKDAYCREELLPEYLELQQEVVNLTFNDSHAENGKLFIQNVENHFEKLNEDCGHIVDEKLAAFKEDSKFICNEIKAMSSGNTGEYKAFRCLETLRCKNKVMKNIELKSGDHRTEIDAVVFTEKAIFIIEVKNPHRDIYIDERGNYYRVNNVSNVMNIENNIGEKMNEKIYLLREAFKSSGYSNANIVSLVVFTNSTICVDNQYDYITTCFLGNLTHIIDKYDGNPIYSDSSIAAMMEDVTNAQCKEAYPVKIDINQYKYRFAELMATLEDAAEKRLETVIDNAENDEPEICTKPIFAKELLDKIKIQPTALIGMSASFAIGFIVSQAINAIRKL